MREWIVTNGLGGYASLTTQNTNTRKYHGLLIASLNPPTKRWVFISNIIDSVKIEDKTYNLQDIKPFYKYDLFPSFTYNFEGVEIKKTIFMEQEKNTTLIKYDINTNKPVKMIHQPLVNSRHFYDVNSQRYLEFEQNTFKDTLVVKPDNTARSLKFFIKDAFYEQSPCWEEIYYEKDHERNESWVDNNMALGKFHKEITQPSEYVLTTTIENDTNINSMKIIKNEIQRKEKIIKNSKLPKEFEKLVLSSDNFIVKRGQGKSIIAGYHWFGDWGRDTLIALPGLALVTKRFDDAKQILINFSKYCENGLIPNAFMDRDSKAVYNTVDASLWYIDRVFQYLKYTNDKKFIQKIWNTLESIVDGYKNGTKYNIFKDEDYLISHDPGLTWMDVKIDNYYPTPRSHKAVEIQALWYNALKIMSELSQYLRKEDYYIDFANNVKNNFTEIYDQQYDVIDTKDLSLRPNQIFLVSLDYTMIDKELQQKIVKQVEEKLLTIFGLRTLSPDDSRYKGCYLTDNKDITYHNGTVWPWLMGPFVTAYVKTNSNDPNARKYAFEAFIKPMMDVFGERWDGNIYEIFDGDPLHLPRGCIAQAWSTAEILRCWVEDIENIKPKYQNLFNYFEIPA